MLSIIEKRRQLRKAYNCKARAKETPQQTKDRRRIDNKRHKDRKFKNIRQLYIDTGMIDIGNSVSNTDHIVLYDCGAMTSRCEYCGALIRLTMKC